MSAGTAHALHQVWEERNRQEDLLASGKFTLGPDDARLTDNELLTVLTEEVGEVAKEVCETIGHPERITRAQRIRLRDELVQVAAVAVGRVELLNKQIAETLPAVGLVRRCDNRRSSTFYQDFVSEEAAWAAVDATGHPHSDYYVLPTSECPEGKLCQDPVLVQDNTNIHGLAPDSDRTFPSWALPPCVGTKGKDL